MTQAPKTIPLGNYVSNYDPTNAAHRRWFQAVLDRVAKHEPGALQDGGDLRALWTSAGTSSPVAVNLYDALRPLLDLIGRGEGNYSSVNRGVAGDTPGGRPGLTALTIAQVQDLQRGGIFAVGRYQFVPETLRIAVLGAGFSGREIFNEETQDWLAIILILGGKRPRLRDYLLGKNATLDQAQTDLALEWASLPLPNGRGAYDGDSAGNRAKGDVTEVRATLEKVRARLAGKTLPPLKLPVPQSAPARKIPPHLRLTKTGMTDGGLVILRLERVKDGIAMDQMPVVSGGPKNQAFRKGKESKAKSMEPLPEGVYSIGPIEFKNGKDNYTGTWGEGLGPVWVGIEYIGPGSTQRSALGIHLDENATYAPGTAACVGIRSVADLKRLVGWLRADDPQRLYVDWGLGTLPKP